MIFTLAASVVLPSCNKDYFDINKNPNSADNASAELVISNAIKTTAAFQTVTFATQNEWMGYWAPSGSYAQSATDGASYYENDLTGDGIWTAYYRNLEDYDYVEKSATASSQFYYIAAAKTMKALAFSQLVDLFNNVPYSQALQGTAALTPKYDAGIDIYTALSTELGTAVTLFQRADAIGSPTQDVFFHGDNAKFAKFANSLRLRLLMRQTEIAGRSAYIQTEMNKIVANGAGFITADAGVNPGYSNSTGKLNPFWGFCYNTAGTFTQDFWRAAQYQITWQSANNDPRYKRQYAPIGNGTWVGTVAGGVGNPVGSLSSTFGVGTLKSVAQDAIIMTAAESYLLQAEAILRGYLAGSAQTMFDNGVQASFTYLGSGSSAAYTSQGGNKQTNYAACATFAERLACIIRQRYVSHNSITPLEAWADYRRLHLPADVPISPSGIQPSIPFRFQYPRSEAQTNSGNLAAQGLSGSTYHWSAKIFWMP